MGQGGGLVGGVDIDTGPAAISGIGASGISYLVYSGTQEAEQAQSDWLQFWQLENQLDVSGPELGPQAVLIWDDFTDIASIAYCNAVVGPVAVRVVAGGDTSVNTGDLLGSLLGNCKGAVAHLRSVIEAGQDTEAASDQQAGVPEASAVQSLASGSLEILAPGTAFLELGRTALPPGASLSLDPMHPAAVLVYMESGGLTVRVEAPMTVARRGELGTPAPSEPEAVPANTEFTLREGDSALFPPAIAGEVRNDGDVEAVASVIDVAVQTAGVGTPTP